IVIDSSKSPGRMKSLRVEKPHRLKALYLIRDGRAVAASEMRRKQVDFDTAVRSWVKANRRTRIMLRSMPREDVFHVKYDDVCAAPLEPLNAIFTFLGVHRMQQLCIPREGSYHAIPGNPILLRGFKQISIDERWRDELSLEQLARFSKLTKRLAT